MTRRIKSIFLLVLLISIIFFVFKGISLMRGFVSSKKVIVIDPGHGGRDSGTIGVNNNYEKDINLSISKKLYDKLKSMGYKVILTRKTDEFVDNNVRANIANRKRARVFISIHGNAMENNNAVNGIQVLYYPNRESTINDPDNNSLAKIMLDELLNGTGAADKGMVERLDLIVLNQTKMPAIIVECGFLSNEKEEKLLLTEEYQDKIVNSIAKGLENYVNLNLEK